MKPKMHGPEEVAFANELFDRVEDALGLAAEHVEDGHHGRGASDLHQSEASVFAPRKGRVVFINTGFLDRTGR